MKEATMDHAMVAYSLMIHGDARLAIHPLGLEWEACRRLKADLSPGFQRRLTSSLAEERDSPETQAGLAMNCAPHRQTDFDRAVLNLMIAWLTL